MDISGEQHLDVRHDIIKKRIDAHGNVIETRPDTIGAPKIERPLQKHGGRLEHNETYCGSCYGAEAADDDCCNNCEEVREAYRKKGWALSDPDLIDQCKREGFLQKIKDEEGEGCNIYGFLDVNKVAGNFHFAPGKSFQQSNVHVHDLLAFHKDSFNISHRINRLAFGDYFPGAVNPLDGVQWTQQTPNAMYQYFLKRCFACIVHPDSLLLICFYRVVPTVFTDVNGHVIQSNQFSVTEHVKGAELGQLQSLPGVFLFYDLSPIKVTFTETHVSFLHFLTNVCAIVGGVFTVSGIIDSFVYHGQKAIKKKMEIDDVSASEMGKKRLPKALRALSAQSQHVLVSARIKYVERNEKFEYLDFRCNLKVEIRVAESRTKPLKGECCQEISLSKNNKAWTLRATHHELPRHQPSDDFAHLCILDRSIIEGDAKWDGDLRFIGEFCHTKGYWEWTEDVLSRCGDRLRRLKIYDVDYASLFTCDHNSDIIKAFCEAWCPLTKTLLTYARKMSISLWDLRELVGLPITGCLYDEVVKFWSKKTTKYHPPPSRKEKKTARPKSTHNPLGDIAIHERWSTTEEALFAKLCIEKESQGGSLFRGLLSLLALHVCSP
ncbi:UNVERIFIED_CONTAM: Endoplasmic reticulum-Golgi intermediate compartment protein 3, partial [Sesamum calycinum]